MLNFLFNIPDRAFPGSKEISSGKAEEAVVVVSSNLPVDFGDQSDEEVAECEGNFIDDDFGLSSIEKENELLRKQEQLIDEEVRF